MLLVDDRIKKFENKYKNQRCFIIGTGPSLKKNDIKKLKNEMVLSTGWFSMHIDFQFLNNVIHCISDPATWRYTNSLDVLQYQCMCTNKNVVYFMESSFLGCNKRHRYFSEEEVYYISFIDGDRKANIIKTDLSQPLQIAGTVIQDIMLPTAFYIGCSEIYLIGCDCNLNLDKNPDWSDSHYYSIELMNSVRKQHMLHGCEGIKMTGENNIREPYIKFKKFFENHNKKIYNATKGGMLEVFERIDYDSLF